MLLGKYKPKSKSKSKPKPSVMDAAIRKLNFRARTVKELSNALKKDEYEDAEISETIDELLDLGYLDDVSYSVSYFEYAENKGWADARAIRELKKKGVSHKSIEEALQKRDDERASDYGLNGYENSFDNELNGVNYTQEEERALGVAEKMVDIDDLDDRGRLPEKTKSKIARRLYGYGYSTDIIYSTIHHIEEELREDKRENKEEED